MSAEEEEVNLIDALIYKLTIVGCNEFYIGSTEDLGRRMSKHKYRSKASNTKLYTTIREHNCQYAFEILYEFKCKNGEERRKMEQHWMNKLLPSLNSQRACSSPEIKKIIKKDWYEENKEHSTQYRLEWKDKNKEHFRNKQKEWRDKNRESIKKNANAKISCICGCEISRSNIINHQKSQKHIKLMAQLENK